MALQAVVLGGSAHLPTFTPAPVSGRRSFSKGRRH